MENKIIKILKSDGVGVMPTDTIYGLVGRALSKKAVNRIYQVRKRNPKKPVIILVSSIADLKLFRIKIDRDTELILKKFWPGKVSIILPCSDKRLRYLHRGTKTLAFRVPKNKTLTNILKKTGPLIAPSANIEGKKPAANITAARKYFGDTVDFYLSAGNITSKPSTLVRIKSGKLTIIRKGAVNIK